MGINLFKLSTIEDFQSLIGNEELLVVWNEEGEMWDKEMQGKKIYNILRIQKANTKSKYPDEIILKNKGNIFFNFRMFVNGESKIVKEVYLVDKKESSKEILDKIRFALILRSRGLSVDIETQKEKDYFRGGKEMIDEMIRKLSDIKYIDSFIDGRGKYMSDEEKKIWKIK